MAMSPCTLAYGIAAEYTPYEGLLCAGIGVRLKTARERAGLSKKALAEAAGASHTTIRLTEEGRTMPSVATAEQLARALGLSPCWLAYGEGPEVLPRPVRRRKS
jgi:transcriptional regulator with XRE-family HTH domain